MLNKTVDLKAKNEKDPREAKFYVETAQTVLENNAGTLDGLVGVLKRYAEEAERMAKDFRAQALNPQTKTHDNYKLTHAASTLMMFVGNLTSGVACQASRVDQNEVTACLDTLLQGRELGLFPEHDATV